MIVECTTAFQNLPRERALSEGIFALGDVELIALLLGTGSNGIHVMDVASSLLETFDGLNGIAQSGVFALADHPGVGTVKALRILGGIELGRRFVYRAGRRREPLMSSQSIWERFGPVLTGLDYEEMWIVAVDATNTVRGTRKVALGGVHACSMLPRDLLRVALADGAIGVVIVHNHPSGATAPSMDDILMTKRFIQTAESAGITLVDHVIIGQNEVYSSFLDLGLLLQRYPAPENLPHRPYTTRLVPPTNKP
ncbi:MAG: DNA repair protein RadC [Polyangiaceae bacterium]|nr:DNA repair protein RadC [Polyangiaceae bacterium]